MTNHAADHHRAYLERSLGAPAAYTLDDHLLATGARADIHLLACHIEPEHVHVLLSLPPVMAVAAAVHRPKGASSRHLRQAFPHLQELHREALWKAGYFVRSLCDVSVAQAKAYLDRQRGGLKPAARPDMTCSPD